MLIRALIVLLVVLNLGAAAWWLTRPAPTPPAEPVLPAGVARLQLVNEAPSMPTQAPVPQVRDAVPPAALAACFSLGPYTRESSALQAQAVEQLGFIRGQQGRQTMPGGFVGVFRGHGLRHSLAHGHALQGGGQFFQRACR